MFEIQKAAIVICTLFAVSIMCCIYFFYASLIENQILQGVNPLIDHYLRLSSLGIILVAALILIITWIGSNIIPPIISTLMSIIIGNSLLTLISVLFFKQFLINGFKKLFNDSKFEIIKNEFQNKNHCCGWIHQLSFQTSEADEKCYYKITCDIIIRNLFKGENLFKLIAATIASSSVLIYCIIFHVSAMTYDLLPYYFLDSSD
ncbi:hypothetical protein TRFO_05880 [Tritrichomonas foetus]|uniref:Tetraspanin family protein n=1 Tax=Tritrichomonas foetus TaxID=1144522 RepID=A0A1J4K8G4_9EUKA|nr:hypothetical protein TRFO_05880 [Tritrichomonas foetus]|eukprot:OHT05717.1 hypothetical protein TRFO_05880 [Tritrichomonas foetus]